MTIAGGQIPRAQILRASDPRPPQAVGVQVLPTNQSVKVSERKESREREEGEREREGTTDSHTCIVFVPCLHIGKDSTPIHLAIFIITIYFLSVASQHAAETT